ncbi:hypothetical protein BDP27DRAFT_1365154 [Rhodocollybia butyracea]|uniref:Uncharacterized protein n=1 Tax=Rhodocollybia butyracea TaxID=206335 RepID=A0A9P5PPU8_9AGAR|nr:hypothetical protein BDP27DRAFT_1365154 [Rhodocollybia butyracea]
MTPEDQAKFQFLARTAYSNTIGTILNSTAYGFAILGILIATRLLGFTGTVILEDIIGFVQITGGLEQPEVADPPFILVIMQSNSLSIQVMLNDIVICWRAWVLFPHSKFWKILLAVCVIGNIGVNFADCIEDILTSDAELAGSVVILDWMGIAFSLLTNMLATTLIGWKTWAYYQTMRETPVWKSSQARNILLLFVESGALFLILQIYALVGELGGSFDSTNQNFSLAETVGRDLLTVLYPIAMMILIWSHNSPITETIHLTAQL